LGHLRRQHFLSKDAHREQPLLGLMDIQVERNAFGRQVDSFEIDLEIPVLTTVSTEEPVFHSIFIRAPLIESVARMWKPWLPSPTERSSQSGRDIYWQHLSTPS
jgi:5'-phosphate synthase pdxT subunit